METSKLIPYYGHFLFYTMRQIKFRGLGNFDSHWYEGDLSCGNKPEIIKVDGFEVYPESVGQFTGLHDKNGTEIFEGDICRHGYENKYGKFYSNNVVVWVQKQCCFALSKRQGKINPYAKITEHTIKQKNIEVLGNIHENKELSITK